jgi:hypothetical protein
VQPATEMEDGVRQQWGEEGRPVRMGGSGTAEPVGKRVRRQLRGCGVEEARGFSNWPHVSAPSPVVLPADHGGRTTGVALPLQSF